MEFGLRDLLTIVGIVGTAIVTFLSTRHNLKDFVRDKTDELKDKIHKQEIEIEKLKGRDENQQQILKMLQTNVLDKIPNMLDMGTKQVNNKNR